MKKFISITFLFIFFLAQYGKVVSYAYCEWENRAVVQCDCEKVFAVDDQQKDHQLSKINAVTKLEDPVIFSASSSAAITLPGDTLHPNISENLLTGFPDSSFHPPSLI